MSTRRSLAAQDGRRSAEAQGGVRTSSTGRNFARKAERRSRDRGSRVKAVLATGSYEGSLTMEGIPGSHEPSFFTVRWSRRSWRLPPRLIHAQPTLSPTRRGADRVNERARRGVSAGEKRERRQGCQRLGRTRHRGKTTPTLAIPSGNGKNARLQKSVGARPAEADRGAVKRLVPRTSRADPKIRGAPTLRKWRSVPGTNEVRVHAVHAWVAEVGRTHFASCPPSGRKARWWNQQGASQKEARSTV